MKYLIYTIGFIVFLTLMFFVCSWLQSLTNCYPYMLVQHPLRIRVNSYEIKGNCVVSDGGTMCGDYTIYNNSCPDSL